MEPIPFMTMDGTPTVRIWRTVLPSRRRYRELHLGITFEIEEPDQHSGHPLTNDGGHRRAGNAHGRRAEPAVDQNGVENDVDDGSGALGYHGIKGPAGGLQQPLT